MYLHILVVFKKLCERRGEAHITQIGILELDNDVVESPAMALGRIFEVLLAFTQK